MKTVDNLVNEIYHGVAESVFYGIETKNLVLANAVHKKVVKKLVKKYGANNVFDAMFMKEDGRNLLIVTTNGIQFDNFIKEYARRNLGKGVM